VRRVKVYYWKQRPNFGDLLSSLLLKRFTRLRSHWAAPDQADIVLIGSILEHLPPDFSGVIAGAGKLHGGIPLRFPNAKILSVRGRLTAEELGLSKSVSLGDPALLANELVPLPEKKYDLGLIPHWTDRELAINPAYTKYLPQIIQVSDDPLAVIAEIGACKKIVSSSLHGIILADAFGIPRRIELAPRMLSHPAVEGGLFKWRDYHSSIGTPLGIGVMQQVDRNVIADKQSEIFDVFETIKKLLNETAS
jgi:pyruvyltransferase